MPIFEFRCSDCNGGFEEYFHRSLTGEEKIVCPHCGSENVVKKLSVFAADVPAESAPVNTGGGCGTGACGSGMCGLN